MPKIRLVYDGDWVYTEKEARIHKLTQATEHMLDTIPGVVDNVDSTSTTDALSANMGKALQDQINAITWLNRYLSSWDATTWLPVTDPVDSPRVYSTWDYYIVAVVAPEWQLNYRPYWNSYTPWVASQTVETEELNINDFYIYDWRQWILQINKTKEIIIDDWLSPTSRNAVENRAVYLALTTKQDNILDLGQIRAWAALGMTSVQPWDNITTLTNNVWYQTAWDVAVAISDAIDDSKHVWPVAPSPATEWMLWYDTTNDVLKIYNGTSWDVVDVNLKWDVNTKTFYISGINDLTNAQAVVDWVSWWNDRSALIRLYTGRIYMLISTWTKREFIQLNPSISNNAWWYSYSNNSKIIFNLENWTVVSISWEYTTVSPNVLATDYDYQTPYTPTYNGSPATKKYVDDTVTSATEWSKYVWPTAPSTPTEWMLWYDTTNDQLKVYDWTNWVLTWKVYTAWTWISISNNDEISNTWVISTNNTYNNIVYMSQADYDALQNKDPNTLYSTPDWADIQIVDNTPYASSWDWDTVHAPSKDVIYDVLWDIISLLANV